MSTTPMWVVHSQRVRRLAFAVLFAALAILLFWFAPLIAGLVAIGAVGVLLVTVEVGILSRLGRDPYDYTRPRRRSGPWEGPR